jgi:hypothetical protein
MNNQGTKDESQSSQMKRRGPEIRNFPHGMSRCGTMLKPAPKALPPDSIISLALRQGTTRYAGRLDDQSMSLVCHAGRQSSLACQLPSPDG